MLGRLAKRFEMIGDVRGSGHANACELVLDRENMTPATELATVVVNKMRQKGVLLGANGIHYNVLKIRPPMVFGIPEADVFLGALEETLAEV